MSSSFSFFLTNIASGGGRGIWTWLETTFLVFLVADGCMCFGPSSKLSQWAALVGGHNMCIGGEEWKIVSGLSCLPLLICSSFGLVHTSNVHPLQLCSGYLGVYVYFVYMFKGAG